MTQEKGQEIVEALDIILDETAAHVRHRFPMLPLVDADEDVAPFRRRALAYLIDGALIGAVLALAGLISRTDAEWVASLATPIQLLPFGYLALSHYGTGQTVGKRLLKIVVVDEVFHRLSLRQSALRAFVAIGAPLVATGSVLILTRSPLPFALTAALSAVVLAAGLAWAPLDCLYALANARRRTLHDRISGTIVIPEAHNHRPAP